MQLLTICKAKIHDATVTRVDLEYVGSIGIDAALMRRADIVSGEQVAVWNLSTGARIETYAIPLDEGSGEIVVNGAAARHFQRGDRVIVAAFVLTDEPIQPRMFLVDRNNAFVRWLSDGLALPEPELAAVGDTGIVAHDARLGQRTIPIVSRAKSPGSPEELRSELRNSPRRP